MKAFNERHEAIISINAYQQKDTKIVDGKAPHEFRVNYAKVYQKNEDGQIMEVFISRDMIVDLHQHLTEIESKVELMEPDGDLPF